MKPMIIIKEKNGHGLLEFTEKDIKEIIESAYQEGYEEGKKANTLIYPTLNPSPYTPPTYPSPNSSGDKFWWDHQPITWGQDPRLSIKLTTSTSKPDSNVTLRG